MPFPVYDTAEDVPEAFRSEYEERDGKWHAKVPDVANLESALEAERTRAGEEETKRKKAERDLAAAKRMQSARDNGVTDTQLAEFNTRITTLESERDTVAAERDAAREETEDVRHTEVLRREALRFGILDDRIEDAMATLTTRVKRSKTGGAPLITGKDGKPFTKGLEEFLSKEFAEEKPWLYEGTGTTGSGAHGSDRKTPVRVERKDDEQPAPKRHRVAAGAL